LISEDIPARVAADGAYQNAMKNNNIQNARIEHDKALARVMSAVLKDDTELFKQFSDNESFSRWLSDMIFAETDQAGDE
jgi:type I restriction enzyme, R subunit